MIILLFFLATDFTLKPFDCPETEYPAKIVNTPQGCLWYKKDNKFKIPKGKICPLRNEVGKSFSCVAAFLFLLSASISHHFPLKPLLHLQINSVLLCLKECA